MKHAGYIFIIVLTVVNLIVGFGCAIPIARLLGKVTGMQKRFSRYFVILIGLYSIECVAFSVGMATQVFSVGLAFVGGIVLGLWLRGRASAREVLKTSFFIALYSSLPTVSFSILIPVVKLVSGEHILSVEEAIKFGVPGFMPLPLNTILGFFGAIAIGTVAFKTVITTGEVSLLIHFGEKCAGDES